MKRISLVLLSFCTLFILFGCTKSIEEKIYMDFEDAVKLEMKVPELNQTLIELEGIESTLYSQIISEGKSSNQEVQNLISNALQNCEDRKEIVNNESSIMKESYEKSTESKKKIEKLDDTKVLEQAEKVQKLFNDRYYTFTVFEKSYQETITCEEKLYHLLKLEQQNLREVEEYVAEINNLYNTNKKYQKKFTELSSQLNLEKNVLYELLEINIKKEISDT